LIESFFEPEIPPNSPRIITDATDQNGLLIRENPSHPFKSVVNFGCGFAAVVLFISSW